MCETCKQTQRFMENLEKRQDKLEDKLDKNHETILSHIESLKDFIIQENRRQDEDLERKLDKKADKEKVAEIHEQVTQNKEQMKENNLWKWKLVWVMVPTVFWILCAELYTLIFK